MEPLAALALAKKTAFAIPAVKKYITSLPDPNTPKFLEARREMFEDWTVENHARTAEVFVYLSERIDNLVERVSERAEDPEAHGVYANYASQAHREPIDERRIMLAYAAAGILDVRLSVAEHASVQRRIDEIEPADVLTLDALARSYGQTFAREWHQNDARMRHAFWRTRAGTEGLRATWCVDVGTDGADGAMALTITPFGDLVLKVLRGYCLSRRDQVVAPGREVTDAMRPEAEARKHLAAIPGLVDEVRVLSRKRHIRYSPAQWSRPPAPNGSTVIGPMRPPEANGVAWLYLQPLSEAEATRLGSLAPFDKRRDEIPHGQPCDALSAVTSKTSGTETWCVRIQGPHDVLRWLADDVEARWE